VTPTEAPLSRLRRIVRLLEGDLRERVTNPTTSVDRIRADYQRGVDAGRTSADWATWLDDRLTQIAMAWVLGTVFVRFAEDNDLLSGLTSAGGRHVSVVPPEKETDALRTQVDRSFSYREWLLSVVGAVAETPVGAWFLDPDHNPLYQLSVSDGAAKELIEFWRQRDDAGRPVWDLTDATLDTCFLTDLYQHLSDAAQKSYSLVQTPPFVVDLILDLTLEPAMDEFGYDRVRIVDPVCGSGQFVLAAFHRLVRKWHDHAPHLHATERVRLALDAVHGVDLAPCAAVITRFRLLIAALKTSGITSFAETRDLGWRHHVAVGDALLGRIQGQGGEPFNYATEDLDEHGDVLTPGYHQVVVGNPPYTMVRDHLLQKRYRETYDACLGKYPLTVPFTQRFFELASHGDQHGRGAGYVGQLIANSFMKREFGRVLAEKFFGEQVTLTHVIDTSGAFIPGHGTPTAILVGRNGQPADVTEVLTVAGLRGEPEVPVIPGQGRVWQSIRAHIRQPNHADSWTQSFFVKHASFRSHPWNLTNSTVTSMLQKMSGKDRLDDRVVRIGYQANTGSDDLFTAPAHSFRRLGIQDERTRVAIVTGSEVRDWIAIPSREAFYPGINPSRIDMEHYERLWPYRTVLGKRPNYSTRTYFADNRRWYEWHQEAAANGAHPWSIVFAWVATHNHFALLRDRVVALPSAPVLKLAAGTSQQLHRELLALLNSSAVCFWLKQHSSSKGQPTVNQTGTGEPWTMVYEFTATRLGQLPLPENLPTRYALELDDLAQELVATTPASVLAHNLPDRQLFASARSHWHELRSRMVTLQEELDWRVYHLYGLSPEAGDLETPEPPPPIHPGERAFEIVLARKVQAGELQTTWFTRNQATPTTELPHQWPAAYREVVESRIRAIERNPTISALEQPEFKRRWAHEDWDKLLHAALREWLLDRCESPELWFDPQDNSRYEAASPTPLTIDQLAQQLHHDPLVLEIADIYRPGATLTDVLAEVIHGEHVPYLAALRYRESGMAKRGEWENVWQLQRQEDSARAAGNEAAAVAIRDRIHVPPRYSSVDFIKIDYWRHRGKHDMSNERFISYPGPPSTNQNDLLIGWAGWGHTLRAQVLINLIAQRLKDATDIERDKLIPLLAGLRELLPWLTPQHSFKTDLDNWMQRLALSENDLAAWRPLKSKRGRPRKKT
jgi:hypothetical protein